MSVIVPKGSEPVPDDGPVIEVGRWYWFKEEDWERKTHEYFGCVTEIGSNYVELTTPEGGDARIHLDEFDKMCRREPDPEKVIRERVERYQGVVREKLGRIREITARLGLSPKAKVDQQEETCRALSVLSGTDRVKEYKKDLIQAKDTSLPKLFEEVRETHKKLAMWMSASALPMKAAAKGLQGHVEKIEDRIFSISLYAGLTEEITQITKGEPAESGEKLHLFQRLLYMDEECLLNYQTGGMEFDDIKKFDRWLAKPENRDRVFPFPRSMVAFQVRRDNKERDWAGTIEDHFIKIGLEKLDEATFLYIRNGDRLYRMNCDLDFGELIFPGQDEFDLNEPMMAKMFCSRVKEIVTKRHYDELVKEYEEEKRKYDEWEKANPDKHCMFNPCSCYDFYDLREYEPFNKSSVYFDEIRAEIDKRVKHYNRIALIIQGLFDRSEVLHPHPPAQLWKGEEFANEQKALDRQREELIAKERELLPAKVEVKRDQSFIEAGRALRTILGIFAESKLGERALELLARVAEQPPRRM